MYEFGDHSWMSDKAYRVHAYAELKSTEELEGFEVSTYRTVYSITACYYPGSAMRQMNHGFIMI